MTTNPADDRADTPAADTEAANEAHDDADTQVAGAADNDDEHAGGMFPRKVVEKLRKQNASLRERAKTAEATVAHLQRQAADKAIRAAGLKPAAVWAVAELGDVLDEQGGVDDEKLAEAVRRACTELGVQPPKPKPTPRPGVGALRSGTGGPHSDGRPSGFAAAFAPQNRQ
ncbi:hypothetical protein C731_0781 [Mycolicibacterium hassiacum DSM 44199]|uniref:Uncharacterized protein n=1 Tax=Mycolicibacterium hassiacum (strain DSM 44199 / CIP 105218 / JCM 12690 / 3849) TaxID=1122247 RepID=K5BKQ1_MYCHD|nr:hypothetical protein [Mycolicibacterium hassiacum]EKF25254.1 hypothetical protein C731_0781 [Mycolicibacterium hassiacum DSM 44199]MDA4088014.1 hypothetical protein [Mycolicibacterium hassiacum DSM 44199]VCT89205.1 hypothetical protein MHAS_00892 [Mycolicibacterium hassiacum DSM 44199]